MEVTWSLTLMSHEKVKSRICNAMTNSSPYFHCYKRCVRETQMPPVAIKSIKGRSLKVLHFNPALPQGACDNTEE